MNGPKKSTDFVKSLLAQEPALNSPNFTEQRQKLLDRLRLAERQECTSRKLALIFGIVALAGFSVLYALGMNHVGNMPAWPDWAKTLGALTTILLPFAALLLGFIYFFRHRRELQRARNDAYQSALQDLPRQVEELRRELAAVRDQLSATPDKAKDRPAQNGYTLVELLVTIMVLGILAGLLFPALSRAKAKSRSIVCLNNLSQLGKALIMYESEWQVYPGAGKTAYITNDLTLISEESWDARLKSYFSGSTNILSCPQYEPHGHAAQASHAYGYNANGSSETHDFLQNLGLGFNIPEAPQRLIRASDVRSPSEMIAIGDLQLPPGLWQNTLTPNLPRMMGGITSFVPKRHGGGAYMVFCDGHVELAKQKQWTEATDSARSRWNNDHEPHRETW